MPRLNLAETGDGDRMPVASSSPRCRWGQAGYVVVAVLVSLSATSCRYRPPPAASPRPPLPRIPPTEIDIKTDTKPESPKPTPETPRVPKSSPETTGDGRRPPNNSADRLSGDRRRSLFLCTWNVENFYDDHPDKVADDLEDWFGANPEIYRAKVRKLAEGLLLMNGGLGPDIACLQEVESKDCLDDLREALNSLLRDRGRSDLSYDHVAFQGDKIGRRIAPGVVSRIPIMADRTRKPGKSGNGRILEVHFKANDHELVVLTAHWTSRVTDGEGDGSRRMSYAEDCYGRVRTILAESPNADVIVCGDFNDEFADRSIQGGLKAVADIDVVLRSTRDPRLLALTADLLTDPPGTIYNRGKWSTFDHICVTRGLLDRKGWSVDPQSTAVQALPEFRTGRSGQPFKFGNAKTTGPRGYSDHLPVAVRLSVSAADRGSVDAIP